MHACDPQFLTIYVKREKEKAQKIKKRLKLHKHAAPNYSR